MHKFLKALFYSALVIIGLGVGAFVLSHALIAFVSLVVLVHNTIGSGYAFAMAMLFPFAIVGVSLVFSTVYEDSK